ncbi:IS4 family transposase, partial [Salmonella enterica]|nr:IS4 family transposase [Salmonella enterica]
MPDISAFVGAIFGASMHMKRIQSLSNATSGVIESGSLAIHAIGAGLAQANELQRKYAIKQVDRLLSNPAFNIPELFRDWVPFIVAERKTIMVSMDWTTFDADGHASLVLSLQTEHGRNTPLLWRTCRKAELKGQRN